MDVHRLTTTLSACGRSILRSRGLTVLAVSTLALALGASIATFSVVNAVLLQALPYEHPQEIVLVREQIPEISDELPITQGEFFDLRRSNRAYTELALADLVFVTSLEGEDPTKVAGARVTPNLFKLLGVQPLHGRLFATADGAPGSPPVCVVSHRFWKSHLGGNPSAIGKAVRLSVASRFGISPGANGLFTLVGVLPPRYISPFLDEDFWFPAEVTETGANRQRHAFFVIGRLRPGATPEQARAEAATVFAAADPELPVHQRPGRSTLVERLLDYSVREVRTGLLVLAAAVGLVLLIACANVANLELTRAVARERELALRAALGSSRRGLFGLTLLESVLIALLGGLLGLLVAKLLLRLVLAFNPGTIPRLEEVRLDPLVLAVAFGLALATGLLVGLFPAARAVRGDLYKSLREGPRSGRSSTALWLRGLLAFAEVALAAIILVGAGLLIRSLRSLEGFDYGFDPNGVLTGEVSLSSEKYPEAAQQEAFFHPALEKVAALPGVTSAALVNTLPLSGLNFATPFEIAGRPKEEGEVLTSDFRLVTPGYFEALHIPLLAGRALTAADIRESPQAVLVDQKFVETFLPGSEPLRHRLQLQGPLLNVSQPLEIVGVVGNVQHTALSGELRPTFYLPSLSSSGMTFVIRTKVPPETLADGLRAAVHSLAPQEPIEIRTLSEIASEAIARPRFSAFMMTSLAGLALVLALVGLFATMRYWVTQRRREIGIRLALGAQPQHILGAVLRQGLLLTTGAVVLGLFAARTATKVLESQLYGVSRTDWRIFAATTAVLLGVAALACWFPARAATKVDPLETLRAE